MCTAINVKTKDNHVLFGRTMDFSYELDPQLYAVSKGYEWKNYFQTHTIQTKYSFMGVGQDISPVTFADGVNEMGLAVAVLYFPGFAQYDDIDLEDDKINITALELIKFLLSTCVSVEEVSYVLPTIRLVGIEDAVTKSIAPLHWIIADKSGECMVIEKMADGLHLLNNPVGVLSNSPYFEWHIMNLRNYMNISSSQKEEKVLDQMILTPFGQGGGTFGMPGDFTSPSRFVRAAFLKNNTIFPDNRDESIMACFHIMESVSIPKGVVMTKRETSDYTQYTAFIDLHTQEYFVRTYDHLEVIPVQLPLHFPDHQKIISLGKLKRPIRF